MAQYYISAQVKVDTSTIQTQLNAIKDQSIKVKIKADGVSETNTKIGGLGDTAKTTSKSILSLGGDLKNTFLKVLKFGAITSVISGFTAAIVGAVKVTKDFDDAQTELKKVSDLSGSSLSAYTKQLGELGETVARTTTEMTQSATSFKRTGASDEDAQNLARVAELYKNVADSEVTSADASAFLVSQMKAFNITANDSIKIVNVVNEVANNFAVDTDDLQTALEKTGSALGTLGNSYEQTVALVESGTSVMQGQASKVGKGLRTIGINLSAMAKNSDTLTDSSGKVSVAFKDENGELKNTYDIMSDLAPQWNTLNAEQKTNLAQTIAG